MASPTRLTKQTVKIDGHQVQLTNLDKILWPKHGLTKADLLDYHVKMADYTLRYWENRPLTITRYPHGVEDEFFYQKNKPKYAPDWVQDQRVQQTNFILLNNLSTLIWLVNQGAIEFHPATYTVANLQIPSYAIIDLDPTPPMGYKETIDVAKICRELLAKMELKGYPKTSGATGIHIYIPLIPKYNFEVSSGLVKLIATILHDLYPKEITLERLVKNRQGIYVDYLQNKPNKTIVGAYSPRPTSEATVSTPLMWDELENTEPTDFTIKNIPARITNMQEPFAEVLTNYQSLDHILHLIRSGK